MDAVQADLVVDDLAALRFIDASISENSNAAIASFYGFAESEVRYREVTGCTLVNDETAPAAIETNLLQPGVVQPLETSTEVNAELESVLDDAFIESDPEFLKRTRAVVILHQGRIVTERYAADIGPETPMPGWSMTKSVMNALTGILVKQGVLTVNTKALSGTGLEICDLRSKITIEHLLHMTSGLAFNEDMADPLADVSHMLLKESDMAEFAARKPLEAEPGVRWQYSTGTSNILAGTLRRVLGEQAYHNFPKATLFYPLGMTKAVLEVDASGTFVGSSFMYATAREWARFGLLYLQDGIWNGERIFPEGWVNYSTTHAPANHQANYGAHFWLDIQEAYRGDQNLLPPDAFHAIGHEGQFVTIVPSHETVIVRLGKTRYPQAWKHDGFVRDVLEVLDSTR